MVREPCFTPSTTFQALWSVHLLCVLSTAVRELDHAMLRRLEKRILVDLPTEEARCAMVRHYLPLEVTPPPLRITSDIDYEEIAKVSMHCAN